MQNVFFLAQAQDVHFPKAQPQGIVKCQIEEGVVELARPATPPKGGLVLVCEKIIFEFQSPCDTIYRGSIKLVS